MLKRDLISATVLVLISLGTCLMAYQLGLGTGSNPGAGFAAFGMAFLLGLMSMGMLLGALIRIFRNTGKESEAPKIKWKNPLLILLILATYGAFFNFLGFSLSTFLLMMVMVWVFGHRTLCLALVVSIVTVVLSYALFVVALGLPLPMGSVWYLLE